MTTAPDDLSVGQVLTRVRNAAAREFRGLIWVVGEIKRADDRTGTMYLDLIEPGGGRRDGGDVTLSAACFKSKWRRLQAELADAGAELAVGREVRVSGMVTVWDNGKVFLEVYAVDVAALVGRRAAERERLLRDLAAAGLLDANKARPVPLVPLRVGLVGSDGSDGHRDFVGVLARSPYAFEITFAHAPVQGPGAGKALADALAALEDAAVDVVCLVRGGGAELDAFDAEPLARAIAACPVPVLTGIGHTADRSVADAAAHTACPTPTACATRVVNRVAAFHAALADCGARLAGAAAVHLGRHHDTLARAAATLRRAADREVAASRLELSRQAARLSPAAFEERLTTRSDGLSTAAGRLLTGTRRALSEAERAGIAQRVQLRAHAPERVLARGYSLTRDAAGRLVTDAGALSAGDRLHTAFAAGSAQLVVDSTVVVDRTAATASSPDREPSEEEQ